MTLSCHAQRHLPRQSQHRLTALLSVCVPSLSVRPFSYSRAEICAVLHSVVDILLIVFINNPGGQFYVTPARCGRCKATLEEDITIASLPDELYSYFQLLFF